MGLLVGFNIQHSTIRSYLQTSRNIQTFIHIRSDHICRTTGTTIDLFTPDHACKTSPTNNSSFTTDVHLHSDHAYTTAAKHIFIHNSEMLRSSCSANGDSRLYDNSMSNFTMILIFSCMYKQVGKIQGLIRDKWCRMCANSDIDTVSVIGQLCVQREGRLMTVFEHQEVDEFLEYICTE